MELNSEEKAIINRAFEQLPFIVSKSLGGFPVEANLEEEAKRYSARVSQNPFPELFDANGNATDYVDKKHADEVLRVCAFFEKYRVEHPAYSRKVDGLPEQRQQAHVFRSALPYLTPENKRHAQEFITKLEDNFPENIQAKKINALEQGLKWFDDADTKELSHAQRHLFDIGTQIADISCDLPKELKDKYDDVVKTTIHRTLEDFENGYAGYWIPPENDIIHEVLQQSSPEDKPEVMSEFTRILIDKFNKNVQYIEEHKNNQDYRYAQEVIDKYLTYNELITSIFKEEDDAVSLYGKMAKCSAAIYGSHSEKRFLTEAKIHQKQAESYKKLDTPTAEIRSQLALCHMQRCLISADLAVISRNKNSPKQIEAYKQKGSSHEELRGRIRQLSEQLKFMQSSTRGGFDHHV